MKSSVTENIIHFFTPYAFNDNSSNTLTRVSAYFNLGQIGAILKVKKLENPRQLEITEWKSLPQSGLMKAIKIISYCTVIIPLIMLIIHSIAHLYYTIQPALAAAKSISNPEIPVQISQAQAPAPAMEAPAPAPAMEASAPASAVSSSQQVANETYEQFLNRHKINNNECTLKFDKLNLDQDNSITYTIKDFYKELASLIENEWKLLVQKKHLKCDKDSRCLKLQMASVYRIVLKRKLDMNENYAFERAELFLKFLKKQGVIFSYEQITENGKKYFDIQF